MYINPTKNSHDQVNLTIQTNPWETETFECDHMIAPLIEKLNKAGLHTEYCCSGHEEDAFSTMYIMFAECDHDTNEKIRSLIDKCSEYFVYETCYRFNPNSAVRHKSNYSQLEQPTMRDLELATELCLGVPFDQVFCISNNFKPKIRQKFVDEVDEYVVLRPAFFRDFVKYVHNMSEVEMNVYFDTIREERLHFIIDGMKKMMEVLDVEYFME